MNTNENLTDENFTPASCQTDVSGSYNKGVHLDWWNDEKTDRFAMLKKYGYQDENKPWKYKPLTNKGIYLIYTREQNG